MEHIEAVFGVVEGMTLAGVNDQLRWNVKVFQSVPELE